MAWPHPRFKEDLGYTYLSRLRGTLTSDPESAHGVARFAEPPDD